ncbi:MAG: exonuclease, partial [Nitrososphaerales archaeon]
YRNWLKGLPGKPIFVGHPAAFDFMFVYWYLIQFTGDSPFTHSAIDLKTYAMALLKRGYLDSGTRDMPNEWFDERKRTHIALDDAISQGELFCNMLASNQPALLD